MNETVNKGYVYKPFTNNDNTSAMHLVVDDIHGIQEYKEEILKTVDNNYFKIPNIDKNDIKSIIKFGDISMNSTRTFSKFQKLMCNLFFNIIIEDYVIEVDKNE